MRAGISLAMRSASAGVASVQRTTLRIAASIVAMEPANVPSANLAVFASTVTVCPPNVYSPGGIPAAGIMSETSAIRSAPLARTARRTLAG